MNTIPDEVRKHRLTVADFQAMEKAGLFMENNRVELINGEIFDMGPYWHTAYAHRKSTN